MAFSFVWHEGEATRLLKATNGPVGRLLARYGAKTETAAKAYCTATKAVDTGRLRGSINWRLEVDSRGLVAIIGTNVEYAIFVHEGTRYMTGRPFLVEGLKQAMSGA